MVDGLDRLRHDAVVGRHDDDRDVRYGGTAGTHGREGFVARRIEERDLLAVELDTVRTDVLRDTPGLAFDDVGFADVVQQRGLTVVDVSHDRDDRRTRHEVFLLVFALVVDGLLDLDRDEFDLVAELLGDHDERFGVEALVDGDHQSQVHAGRDDLRGRHVHHRRQLAHGHELRDFEGRAFLFLAFELFVHTLGNGVAFILAVFGTLAFGTLGRQACQGVLYLLRNLLVAHFGAYDRLGCGLTFVFVATAFARFGLVLGAGTVLPALSGTVLAALAPLSTLLVAAALRIALRGFADVDLFLLQALALVLAAGHESRHVHRAEYLRPGKGHGLRTEEVVFGSGRFRRGGRGFCGLGVRLPGSLRCGCRRVSQVQRAQPGQPEQQAPHAPALRVRRGLPVWQGLPVTAGLPGLQAWPVRVVRQPWAPGQVPVLRGPQDAVRRVFPLPPSGRVPAQPWVWATGRSCRGTSAAGFRP